MCPVHFLRCQDSKELAISLVHDFASPAVTCDRPYPPLRPVDSAYPEAIAVLTMSHQLTFLRRHCPYRSSAPGARVLGARGGHVTRAQLVRVLHLRGLSDWLRGWCVLEWGCSEAASDSPGSSAVTF